ncbi:hypothetical protein [Acidovorax sp. SDU_ACID1]|uniref:hypothetical protein n=1 Tax=Acidovorax sp. SDU_ACID1 TaxID=3136632 RepID=UPI00387380A1
MPLAFFDLPQDPALCPGDALSAEHLRQLLRAALPDKGRHKAAGWFGQTDFLLTRSHVDEDQDAYHDALFITLWKRWDFWIALPAHAPGRPLARAWARLRGAATPAAPDTLECQYRRHDGTGRPGSWLPLDAQAPPEALQACTEGWHGVLRYWRLAEAQRRAGRPLRARLHALLTPARVEALTRLPVFTGQRIDGWEGEAWACTLQPHPHGGRALRLDWRNGDGAPEDTRASYQIDLAEGAGTAHPPGLRISYHQREGDALELLPNDAVEHMDRLLRLFAAVEQQPPDAQTADGPLPALPRTPPSRRTSPTPKSSAPRSPPCRATGKPPAARTPPWCASTGPPSPRTARRPWPTRAACTPPPCCTWRARCTPWRTPACPSASTTASPSRPAPMRATPRATASACTPCAGNPTARCWPGRTAAGA